MTHILVTTDGSALGHLALPYARALADALHAQLTVLSVLPDDTLLVGEFAYVPPVGGPDERARVQATEADLAARLPGAAVRVETAGGRHTIRAILDAAQDLAPDLIVMSTHGRSGLGRALLGSVAEGVVHHAGAPVLLVRAGQPVTAWAVPGALGVTAVTPSGPVA
ncbi:universal stress protein [Deinococcus kurensis]|uniref:universal stress protein n=1 Tax=Deinococcus kurensis TaxID=2662757 RepID=UPI0012D35BDE|nr:universal stress protein [Deinococcus kurensis]